MTNVYMDSAATTGIDPDILSAMNETALNFHANPSSLHADGRKSAQEVKKARERVAGSLQTDPANIIFTSGGTESNMIVLHSLLRKRGKGHIIITGIEHPSVYDAALTLGRLGFTVSVIDAEPDGIIKPEKIGNAVRDDTILVSVMAVNNETGAIQPIREISLAITGAVRSGKRKIHFHTDAVQALGKIPFVPETAGIDSASFSSHKIHGPKGAGILYIRKTFEVLGTGGGQEFGIRSGTENVPGIVGTSIAVEKAVRLLDERQATAVSLKQLCIDSLQDIPGIKFVPGSAVSTPGNYSPFILSVSVPPIPGEVLVRVLSDNGFSVSTGAACSAGKKRRVLQAMGVEDAVSFSAIRISLDSTHTPENIESFCTAFRQLVERLSAPLYRPMEK